MYRYREAGFPRAPCRGVPGMDAACGHNHADLQATLAELSGEEERKLAEYVCAAEDALFLLGSRGGSIPAMRLRLQAFQEAVCAACTALRGAFRAACDLWSVRKRIPPVRVGLAVWRSADIVIRLDRNEISHEDALGEALKLLPIDDAREAVSRALREERAAWLPPGPTEGVYVDYA